MRNLQKILALVMAMVMSFSLLATVNAADFPDAGEISETYSDAVTVLNGLRVFQGYKEDGTFRPKGNITRAEVAAIIYRIVTGDVDDTQKDIYSSWGKFNDVLDGSWYAGYVNYCANAGYIKGYNNTTFGPNDQVTGYQALAMILRAVGYDKNGEFTGSQWQIRTASIARERGVTKNVTDTLLGQAATRETVAELLFRSIIIPKVDFNANTLSYTVRGDKETLGYESLKLEEVTGIVTANEYADLENTKALNSGKTRMVVEVDKKATNYTLDYSEENLLDGLDAIGEEHNAYIQNANTTSAKVLVMAKTDKNKTYETLEKKDIKSDSDFRSVTGFQRGSDTETRQFINFGEESSAWKSDWRIKYVVSMDANAQSDDAAIEAIRYAIGKGFDLPTLEKNRVADTTGYSWDTTNGRITLVYTQEFKINEDIGSRGRTNIETIFNIADRVTENGYVRGEVYVGTTSLKDVSDSMSLKQFKDEYINTEKVVKVEGNEYGNWLKVIDNDNDGQADYVLKLVYTMAQVVRAKDGKYGLDVEDKGLCGKNGEAVNYLKEDNVKSEDTLVLDDIVYYAVIDEVPWATKAEMVTAKVDTVNRKDEKITTADGTEYQQSGVCGNEVVSNDYNCGVVNMNGSATYDMYLDRGGYMALFRDSHNDFTLIVDGWYNRVKSGTEYSVRAYNDETGRQEVVDINRGGSLFIGDVEWRNMEKRDVLNNNWYALKWLGNTNGAEALENVTRNSAGNVVDNNAGKLNGGMPSSDDNTAVAVTNHVKTTVATLAGDVIQPVDYSTVGGNKVVRMLAPAKNEIPKAAASYHAKVYSTNGTDTAYNVVSSEDAEVRALSSTVYYLVYPAVGAESGFAVERYVGYSNVPDVKPGYIEDVYAVGTRQDRTSTLGQNTYYTANVVVVELNSTYKGNQEQVFIYDMPVVSSSVTIEEVGLIHENGTKEDGVKIDFGKSRIRDYQVAMSVGTSENWRNWGPGLYYMYPTNEEGVYTVQPMYAEDIAATDYVVGWSNTSNNTIDADYISVLAFNGNVVNRYSNSIDIAYDVVEKSVNRSDCTIYTLGYDNRGVADLGVYEATAGNIRTYLGEQKDVNGNNDFAPYDHINGYGRNLWNQNRVLVHYKDNNAKYAISFSNKTNDGAYARKVWTSSLPASANTTWAKAGGAIRMAETLLRVSDSRSNRAWFVDETYNRNVDRFIATVETALRELNLAALKDSSIYDRAFELFGKLNVLLGEVDPLYLPAGWMSSTVSDKPNYDEAVNIWNALGGDLTKLSSAALKDLQDALTAAKEDENLTKAELDLLDKIQTAIDELGKPGEEEITITANIANVPAPEGVTAKAPASVTAGSEEAKAVKVELVNTSEKDYVIDSVTVIVNGEAGEPTKAPENQTALNVNLSACEAGDEVVISVTVKEKTTVTPSDNEVVAGTATPLKDVKVGDTITLTVAPKAGDTFVNNWYAVECAALKDHDGYHAAKMENGKLSFTYVVQDGDTTTGVTVNVNTSVPIVESNKNPGMLMGWVGTGLANYQQISPTCYDNVVAKMARMAVANDAPNMGQKGAVLEFEVGGKTFYFVYDETDKLYKIAESKKAQFGTAFVEAAAAGTGFDMDVDYQTVKGMDKTSIVTNEAGEVTAVNLTLGQPKGPGAKLPTTMKIDDGTAGSKALKVTVTWYDPDGKVVKYADERTEGYTYVVSIDPAEQDPDVTLGDVTVTVTPITGEDENGKDVLGTPVSAELKKEDIATGGGLTVPSDAKSKEDIVAKLSYSFSLTVAEGAAIKAEAKAGEAVVKSGDLVAKGTKVTVTVTGIEALDEGDTVLYTVNGTEKELAASETSFDVTVDENTTVLVSVKKAEGETVTVKVVVGDKLTTEKNELPATEGEEVTIVVNAAGLTEKETVKATASNGSTVTLTPNADKTVWTAKVQAAKDLTVTFEVSKDEVLTVNVDCSNKNLDAPKKVTVKKDENATITVTWKGAEPLDGTIIGTVGAETYTAEAKDGTYTIIIPASGVSDNMTVTVSVEPNAPEGTYNVTLSLTDVDEAATVGENVLNFADGATEKKSFEVEVKTGYELKLDDEVEGVTLTDHEDGTYTIEVDPTVITAKTTITATVEKKPVVHGNLVVEAVGDREKIEFTGSSKKGLDLQENIKIVPSETESNTYVVTGKAFYVDDYTGVFGSTYGKGYFIALKLSAEGVKTEEIGVDSVDATNGLLGKWKWLVGDNMVVRALTKLDDGTKKPMKVYAGGVEYTLDLSGVEWGDESAVLTVEPVGADEVIREGTGASAKDYGKKGSDIQNITVTQDEENPTKFNVSGNAFYISSAWDAYHSKETGFFVALKLSYPDATAGDINGRYADSNDAHYTPLGHSNRGSASDAEGLALIKLNKTGVSKADRIFDVKVFGKTYTIDLSGVTEGSESKRLVIDALSKDGTVDGNKISDVQENVKIEKVNGDTELKVTGTLKWVDKVSPKQYFWSTGYYVVLNVDGKASGARDWNEFGLLMSSDTNGSGPKQLPGATNDSESETNPGVIVWRVNSKADDSDKGLKGNNIRIKYDGVIYTIDVSELEFEAPAKLKGGDTEAKIDTSANNGWESVTVGDVSNVSVKLDSETLTYYVSGEAFYVDQMPGFSGALARGYYVVLDLDGTNPHENGLKINEVATPGGADGLLKGTADRVVWRLTETPSGRGWENTTVEGYDCEWTLDFSGVKKAQAKIKVAVAPEETYKSGETSTVKVSDLQEKITVEVVGNTIKVGGTAKYQDNFLWFNNEASKENKGYYIALKFEVPVHGSGDMFLGSYNPKAKVQWKPGTTISSESYTKVIVFRIAGPDKEKNKEIEVGFMDDNAAASAKYCDAVYGVWTLDLSGLTLTGGPDAASTQALAPEDAFGFETAPEEELALEPETVVEPSEEIVVVDMIEEVIAD